MFEIYHFVEKDPAALHRDFSKQLNRSTHANRALPQLKAPLGHIMFDLAPLAESIACGEARWSGAKNLPILVRGTPIGQVSVRIAASFEDAELEAATAAAADPRAPLSSEALPPQQHDPLSQSYYESHHPSLSSSPQRAGAGGARPNDPFDLSHLISQAEDMTRNLAETINGPPMDVGAYIQQQNERQQQLEEHPSQPSSAHPVSDDQKHAISSHPSPHFSSHSAPPVAADWKSVHFDQPSTDAARPTDESKAQFAAPRRTFDAAETSTLFAPLHASSAPAPIASSFRSSTAASSHRPFASPPSFADWAPAPAHLFPHTLPKLPAVLDYVPPFPQAATGARAAAAASASYATRSFLDAGGLLAIWLRIRRVTIYKPAHERPPALGGRAAGSLAASGPDHAPPANSPGVEELMTAKRRASALAAENTFMVLHYHLFPDLRMSRTPALHAPARGETRPAYFHYADNTPRVHSRALLASLAASSVPIEVYAYHRKPSWKDAHDRDTGRYTPQAPAQVMLARTSLPLESLTRLPTACGVAEFGQPWVVDFLRARTAMNTVLPIYDPLSPSPVQVGEIELALGWGSANDAATIDRLETGTITAQRIVRGFLVRRRIRRARLAHALEEEAREREEEERERQLEEEEDLAPPATASPQKPVSFPLPLPLAQSYRSMASSPAASPRSILSSARSQRLAGSARDAAHAFRDAATSPLPSGQVSFRLNFPPNSPRGSPRRDTAPTTPRRSHTAPSHVIAPPPVAAVAAPAPAVFVPAPREEDRKDFISYTYASRHRPAATAADRAASVRSFTETLAQIQAARETAARALQSKGASPSQPRVALTPAQTDHRESPPQSAHRTDQDLQRALAAEAARMHEEHEQKYDARAAVDSAVESDLKSSMATPPRARRTPVHSPASARKPRLPQTPGGTVFPTEEYSDVDVDEYDDEDWPSDSDVSSTPVPSVAAPISPPVRDSYSEPELTLSFLPPSYDGLDASVVRRRLQQQMDELDEIQQRMKWRLSGRTREEFEAAQNARAYSAQTSAAPTPARYEARAQPYAPVPLVPTPMSPSAFLSSPQSLAASHTPVPLSPAVQSHQASPAPPSPAPIASTPIRADAPQSAPRTPPTPASFLSPSPTSAHAADRPTTSYSERPTTAYSERPSSAHASYSPPPAVNLSGMPSPRSFLPPIVSPATRSPQAPAASITAAAPTPSVPAATLPSPYALSPSREVSVPEVLSAPVPPPGAQENGLEDDDEDDLDGLSDDSDVSSGSDHEDEDHSRWNVRVTANNVDVHVLYDAGGGAVPGTSAQDRARLFPNGLHGEREVPAGARDRPAAHTLAASSSSSYSSRWDPNYHPSEEDARRMERIARIMAE